MMYRSFPRITEKERLEHMPSVTIKDVVCGDTLNLEYSGNETHDIMKIASVWGDGRKIIGCDTLFSLEQWIPFGRLKAELPIYKFHYAGKDCRQVYISSVSKEVLQKTDSGSRFWAWLGAIPHWVYFTWLRQDKDLWMNVVIWLSGIGSIMVIIGLWIGISVKARSSKSSAFSSPYIKRWHIIHHTTGLFFGLFVFTWVFSGMMSLTDLPEWIIPVHNKIDMRSLVADEKLSDSLYVTPLEQVVSNYNDIKKIELGSWCGIPLYRLKFNDSTVVLDASKHKISLFHITKEQIEKLSDRIFGYREIYAISILHEYDNHYYSGKLSLELPVYKIVAKDSDNSIIYINPKSGRSLVFNNNSLLHRFLYSGLHEFDFPWFSRHPLCKRILMWFLLIGGTFVSISGLVLGIRVLKRAVKRRV